MAVSFLLISRYYTHAKQRHLICLIISGIGGWWDWRGTAGGIFRSRRSIQGGSDVQTYIVYRLDYFRQMSEPVGKMVERRSKERANNTKDLLKLAERIFPPYPPDSHLVITPE
jgi:hypothetical protein